jgi:multicomponent Na+:H+ antiporter subunit A
VVVGLVLDVLRSLGSEIDEHFDEHEAEPAPDSLVEDVMAGAPSTGAPSTGAPSTGGHETVDLSTESTGKGQG